MHTFQSRDPSSSAFWSERFEQDFKPWDLGTVPQQFQRFVALSPQPYATLIPGCGTGYEVASLSKAGWDVTAIDFSQAAVDAARKVLGPLGSHVQQADFFHFLPQHPIELIYERAFFCALPPHMREAVIARWAALLPPGGLLAGYFYFGEGPKGPPFGIGQAELESMLAPAFERIVDEAVTDSAPVFAGKERWQIWRRWSGGSV
jgi:SAM-dependent methyltransferase